MDVFGWEPLVWVIRVALLLALAAGVWVGFLYFFRYLRPTNVKQLATRKVAEIEEVRLLGAALKMQTQQQELLDLKSQEISEIGRIADQLNDRLTQVEDAHQELSGVVKKIQDRPLAESEGRAQE